MKGLFKTLSLLAFCGIAYIPNLSSAVIVYVSGEGFVLNDVEGEFASFPFSEVSETLRFSTWIDSVTDEFFWSWGSETPRVQGVKGPDSWAVRLEAGTEIGDNSVWADRGVGRMANIDGGGNFYDTFGFIGVRVYEETDGWRFPDALPFYGWIRVEHSASAGTLTVHDWAWNSFAGEPILAGAIPEPRVYALAFGVGIFGFVLVRRWCGKGSS